MLLLVYLRCCCCVGGRDWNDLLRRILHHGNQELNGSYILKEELIMLIYSMMALPITTNELIGCDDVATHEHNN